MIKFKSFESYAICNLRKGSHFYSDKQDKHLTALCSYYKKNIKTERIITIKVKGDYEVESKYITKVTIL